jgi:hypothetical protein
MINTYYPASRNRTMADDSDGRSLLDDEGRIFGLVNVIDVLVVLLVIAVVAAGAALLLGGEAGEPDSRYATIDLGEQPEFVAEQIEAGDAFEPEGTDDSVTITDVYRYDGAEGTNVVVRGRINGTTLEPEDPDEDPVFQFQGGPVRIGQQMTIRTPDYEVAGELTQVQRSGESLPTEESTFLVRATVSDSTADEVAAGDEYTVAGNALAEITDVQQFPAGDGESALLLSVSARALDRGGSLNFGSTPIRVGNGISFAGDGYQLSGEIIDRGGESPTGESDFVIEATVPSGTADELAVGDTFRTGGETLAEITALQQFPGRNDGERTALIGISARTVERGGTTRYVGQALRLGNVVPFESEGYQLSGQIIQRTTSDIETERRPFVIETTVPTPLAADIDVGDEFRLAGETVVSVEQRTAYTTDRADRRRVVLGVSATTREDDGTILFGDRELRIGQSLPVETSEYDINGEIIRRGSLDEAGEATTRTASIAVDNVRPEIAEAIEVGQIEQVDELTTAEIVSKDTAPAEVILESDDGNIFLRDHPRNLDVDLEAELAVRELDDGSLRFRGESLRTGDTITLELGQLRISGRVTAIEG